MQSAILVEPGRVELREVAVPQPSPGSIIVRIRAALTDGTDLKAYRRGHPQMPMPTPFGHEFSGDVAAVGADAVFAIGDAVMSVHSAPCLRCFWCGRSEEELCESVMRTKILGAYAQFIEIPEHIVRVNAFRKPEHLSYVAAAFLEPLSCVVHSIDFLQPKPGGVVAILGDGGFGFLHAMLLQRSGATPLLAGRRDERRALALQLGIAYLDTRECDLTAAIHARTQGRGADALIECTGQIPMWEGAPAMLRRGGTASFFGGLPGGTRVGFDSSRMHYDEVRLISPFHFRPASVRRAFEFLVGGAIDPLPLVTDTVPLGRIREVFERLDRGDGMKFAIEP